jgi:hypothetical protein
LASSAWAGWLMMLSLHRAVERDTDLFRIDWNRSVQF